MLDFVLDPFLKVLSLHWLVFDDHVFMFSNRLHFEQAWGIWIRSFLVQLHSFDDRELYSSPASIGVAPGLAGMRRALGREVAGIDAVRVVMVDVRVTLHYFSKSLC